METEMEREARLIEAANIMLDWESCTKWGDSYGARLEKKRLVRRTNEFLESNNKKGSLKS